MKHETVRKVALISLLTVCACQDERDRAVTVGICGPITPEQGFVARDSSGVRIVENLTPEWPDEEAIRIGAEPLAVIGARESDPDDVIGRLASALLLDEGKILVADRQTRIIRVHGPDGSFLYQFGGDGQGPGQLSRSVAVYRGSGDTLVVAHEFTLKYARFLSDGTYLDGGYVTAAPGEAPIYHGLLGVFGDGSFLVNDRSFATPKEPKTEVRRGGWAVVRRLDPATRQMDSIGDLPGVDYFNFLHEGGEFDGSITFGDVPFGRVASWITSGSDLYIGRGDHFEVERYSLPAGLTAVIRLCEEARPVDPADIARAIEERLSPNEAEDRRLEERALRGIPLPTVEPAHHEMRADDARRLWVRAFTPDWEPQTWRVFDPDGRWLGSVTLPSGARLLDVRGEKVLIALTNDVGVETVLAYGIN
jgi:hypothetical protein